MVNLRKLFTRTSATAGMFALLFTLPQAASATSGVTYLQMSAGNTMSVALASDHTVWEWGGDYYNGQSNTPIRVLDPGDPSGYFSGVKKVVAGEDYKFAIKEDGSVWWWGYDVTDDQMFSERAYVSTPQQAPIDHVKDIAIGGDHVLFLKEDGSVWAIGSDAQGQLGDPRGNGLASVPQPVYDRNDPTNTLHDVVDIGAGWMFSLAVKTDGTVLAWGQNVYGQIGNGTEIGPEGYAVNYETNEVDTPEIVLDPQDPTGTLTGVRSVDAGGWRSMALKSDGTVWYWGETKHRVLNDEFGNYQWDIGSVSLPTQVRDASDATGYLQGIVSADIGQFHGFGVKADGTVWGWGQSEYDSMGNPNAKWVDNDAIPVRDPFDPTKNFTDVQQAISGNTHSLALKADGSLWSWGSNDYGQLGNGTNQNAALPSPL